MSLPGQHKIVQYTIDETKNEPKEKKLKYLC